jgi:hypothetical protein
MVPVSESFTSFRADPWSENVGFTDEMSRFRTVPHGEGPLGCGHSPSPTGSLVRDLTATLFSRKIPKEFEGEVVVRSWIKKAYNHPLGLRETGVPGWLDELTSISLRR